jgi:hypothetical protein
VLVLLFSFLELLPRFQAASSTDRVICTSYWINDVHQDMLLFLHPANVTSPVVRVNDLYTRIIDDTY